MEGKGMGLFLVKTQVEALNGTIEIESTVNRGTTFHIVLPLN
ncbi:MAG TPA: ATP-binding protein [Cyclobacteriaceae bacterium]|nr:ATP-binding protein [Cyclobacteriaceae bacterium]